MRLSEEEQALVDAIRDSNPTEEEVEAALERGGEDIDDGTEDGDDLVENPDDPTDLDDALEKADAGGDEEVIVANQG